MWESIKFHGRKAKFCVSATEKIIGSHHLHCWYQHSFKVTLVVSAGYKSDFNRWWPFWARICAISRQFTRSVRLCSVDYKDVDRRLQMLDKDYKIPDCGKPSIFVGERQSSALVLLKKSLRSRVINESLRNLRGLVNLKENTVTLSDLLRIT